MERRSRRIAQKAQKKGQNTVSSFLRFSANFCVFCVPISGLIRLRRILRPLTSRTARLRVRNAGQRQKLDMRCPQSLNYAGR